MGCIFLKRNEYKRIETFRFACISKYISMIGTSYSCYARFTFESLKSSRLWAFSWRSSAFRPRALNKWNFLLGTHCAGIFILSLYRVVFNVWRSRKFVSIDLTSIELRTSCIKITYWRIYLHTQLVIFPKSQLTLNGYDKSLKGFWKESSQIFSQDWRVNIITRKINDLIFVQNEQTDPQWPASCK